MILIKNLKKNILLAATISIGLTACGGIEQEIKLSKFHDSEISKSELNMITFGIDDYIKSHDLDEKNSVAISKLAELLYIEPELGKGNARNYLVTRTLDNYVIISTPEGSELAKTPSLLDISDFDTIKYTYPYLRTKKLKSLKPSPSKCKTQKDVGIIVFNQNGMPFYCIKGDSGIRWHLPSLMVSKE
jgi:hypothetical protein